MSVRDAFSALDLSSPPLSMGLPLIDRPDPPLNIESPSVTPPVGEGMTRRAIALVNDHLQASPTAVQPQLSPTNLVPDTELITYFDFESRNGNTVLDTAPDGVANHGTLRQGATLQFEPSPRNQVADFDGQNDVITLQNAQNINLAAHAQRTIAFWFRAEDLSRTQPQILYEEGGGLRGLNVTLQNGTLVVGGWNLPESNWTGTFLSTTAVQPNQWHHVALVLNATANDPTPQAGAFAAYLDGVEFGRGQGSQLWEHSNGIGLGGIRGRTMTATDQQSEANNDGFHGQLDDVRLYNRALSASELGELANITPTGNDTTPPTATLATSDLTNPSNAPYAFTVTYQDESGIEISSLEDQDIRVTGPNGFNQAASLIAVEPNTSGTPRQATYQINAPGGSWDVVDNGTYVVTLQGNQVRDNLGNTAPETNLGGFQVAVAAPGILSLSSNSYTVNEADGTVAITVQRTGNTADAVSVDYQTLTGTATPEDLTPIAGTLNFAPGETEQVIQVAIANDSLQEAPEIFGIAIDNVVGNANLLAPRTAQVTIIDNDSPTPPGNGNGLKAEYFNDIDFSELRLTRNDSTVNFNWGTGAPDSRLEADTFSVRWSGEIEARFDEVYQFRTVTDDGVRLWINGQLIVDQFRDQSATSHTGTIELRAGQRYTIQMDYYENLGDASAQLFWSSTSQTEELVPQSQLFSPDTPTAGVDQETIASGLNQPTAMDWTPNGDLMFVAEKSGVVKVYQNGELLATPFIDISDQVNDVRDRGLLDIAIHPDFPNQPYVYLLYTYDPPQVFQNTGLAGPDGTGNRAGRLIRVRADGGTGFTTAIAGSEEILLGKNSTWDNFNAFVNSTNNFNEPPAGINPDGSNVQDFLAADSESHTIGSVEFGPDGALYVSNGDGTSYNRVDPRTVRVQDINNLSGKILRINPDTGEGLANNPFFDPADPNANRSKVFQFGLRNPFRFAVDDATGEVWVGDVGWTQWEELNQAGPGANFGWPYYEGESGTSSQTGGYRDLPAAQEFYNSGQSVTPSIFALNHAASGINAIIMGDIYRGNLFPEEYRGDIFFNDLGQGIVRNLNLNDQGQVESVATFDTGATAVVQIQTGPDGNLYYVDLDNGQVGRWTFA